MDNQKLSLFGMVRAEAQCLKQDGVCLAAFRTGATFCFQGRVEARVLVGAMEVNGFLMKQGEKFRALYSPSNCCHLSLTAVDASGHNLDLMTSHPRGRSLHFSSTSEAVPTPNEIRVDLEPVDVEQLNAMIAASGWTDVAVVVLLRGINSALTWCLEAQDSILPALKHSLIPGFQMLEPGSQQQLTFTQNVRQLARDLAAFSRQAAPVVVVSGACGSGKSTLCRYLINYLLNSHPAVGFLECDVGQTEFTVPGVVALHVVEEPLLGPPFTHIRSSGRAYYFGSKTPRNEPGLYGRLISTLLCHFTADVRPGSPHMPLVINSCGWLTDLGVPIFLELLKAARPTHLVKFEEDSVVQGDEIPPTCDIATPPDGWGFDCHLFPRSDLSSCSPSSNLCPPSPLNLADQGDASAGILGNQYEPIMYSLEPQVRHTKNPKLMRKLAYIAYFSPVLPSAIDLAPELKCGVNVDSTFLLIAPPKSVSWSSVAIHVLHRKVPPSQLLYALNGKFVALGHVEEAELVSCEARYPGMVKTLRSQLPLVQFIGLGLLRGIDVVSRRFYITTPEDSETLSKVNVLVLDHVEEPDCIVSRKDYPTLTDNMAEVPYHSREFASCDIGRYCWKP